MTCFNRAQQAFDPSELAVLQAAFKEACQELKLDPDATDGADGDEKRHALAAALIDAAAAGERNPQVLKTQALLALRAWARHAE